VRGIVTKWVLLGTHLNSNAPFVPSSITVNSEGGYSFVTRLNGFLEVRDGESVFCADTGLDYKTYFDSEREALVAQVKRCQEASQQLLEECRVRLDAVDAFSKEMERALSRAKELA